MCLTAALPERRRQAVKLTSWPVILVAGVALGIGSMMVVTTRYQVTTVGRSAVLKLDKWTGNTWINRDQESDWELMPPRVTLVVTSIVHEYRVSYGGLFDDLPQSTNPSERTNLLKVKPYATRSSEHSSQAATALK